MKLLQYLSENEGTYTKDKLELLRDEGIVDENNVIDVLKLVEQKLKTGNGSNNKDVYVIEDNHLYYYDNKGNKTDLGDLGNTEETIAETDPDLFEITDDGTISIKNKESYYKVNTYNFSKNYIKIPCEIRGIKVTQISDYMFSGIKDSVHKGFTNIEVIIIPDGVTSIGLCAFYGCTSLTTIEFTSSLIEIKNSAFESCYNLKKVNYNGTEEQWNEIVIEKGNKELITSSEQYLKFEEEYLSNKKQEELEELMLKSVYYTDTFEEYLNEEDMTREDIEQIAQGNGMEYVEYLKYLLKSTEDSWVYVEYTVSKQGGTEKTIEELEQMFAEKYGGTGSFDDLLAQEGMTREDFYEMIKEQGFRTEEDFLKVQLFIN